ncbi:ABC transporter substrate-binding protein [Prosthecomicrobium sp. N25]|uniref:ABC transporter substrate-binding protein n=1 Tax=Prosthecomicrobium sp. N25 TaxID=3129254 RepID=UPI003077B5E6
MLVRILLGSAALLAPALAEAACPAVTVADPKGVPAGAFPQQYELADFEAKARCKLVFSENPAIKDINARIRGNAALPPLAERLPAEPLVVAPYQAVGKFGGVLNVMSNGPDSGTADVLSLRHVNLVRYSDDLQTIVPNVAKSWEWNADFTELTFHLRKGHKWSDGQPFTSADVKFWYDNLALDPAVNKTPKSYVLVGGKPMTVIADDPLKVVFKLPAPKPGLLAFFAVTHAPPFRPKHFLGQFHPAVNPKADETAQALGFSNGYDAIKAYTGNSDWTDITPMRSLPDKIAGLPRDTMPTLEAMIYVKDTPENRKTVANPYFFMVDTAGQQLPYIPEQNEIYVKDAEVRNLKLINGEVDYKAQSLQLAAAPLLLDRQKAGNFTIQLRPQVAFAVFGFNLTHDDPARRKLFGDLAFRQAMSLALNRKEMNEAAFFGLGTPVQFAGFSPVPKFLDQSWEGHFAEFDPKKAKALLDGIGLVDRDGDGFRDFPDGSKLVVSLLFSTQATSAQVVELVGKYWGDVGVRTTVKEVTTDEFRAAQSANKLDVSIWQLGQPLGTILAEAERFRPPFGGYFSARPAMLWGEWVESKGAKGVEPPDWAKQMSADVDAFQSAPVGGPASVELGNRLMKNMAGNLVFIGTVRAPGPIFHRNVLANVPKFAAHADEFRWTYPYRPQQWYFAN